MQGLFQVEQITSRRVYSGKVYYCVKWKNSEQTTWEMIKLLGGAKRLIKQYNKKQKLNHGKLEDNAIDGPNKNQKKLRKARNSNKNVFMKKENIQFPDENDYYFGDEEKNDEQKPENDPGYKDNVSTSQSEGDKAEKPVEANQQLKVLYDQGAEACDEVKLEVQQQDKMTQSKVVAEDKKIETKKELERISFLRKVGEQCEYVLQFSNGDVGIYTSTEVVSKHLLEIVKYLEQNLIKKKAASN